MSHILVSGSLAYDRIMDFDGLFKEHFLPEKLHNINISFTVPAFVENFGGTAGNIAYNLALLGIGSRIISTAGSDFEKYREKLQSLGVDVSATHLDPNQLTSSAFIITDKADNQIAAFSVGAGREMYLPMPETEGAACAILGAGNEADMRALPAHYRSRGLPFMYDPGQRIPMLSAEDLHDAIVGATVLFGNDYEIGLILNKTGWDETMLHRKAAMIVTTYGKEGTRITTQESEVRVPAVPVAKVIDPTGAGDAYRAGFIAGYINKLSPELCARLGSTTAAYAVEKYGTQNHRFTREDLATRYKEGYGEELPI